MTDCIRWPGRPLQISDALLDVLAGRERGPKSRRGPGGDPDDVLERLRAASESLEAARQLGDRDVVADAAARLEWLRAEHETRRRELLEGLQ